MQYADDTTYRAAKLRSSVAAYYNAPFGTARAVPGDTLRRQKAFPVGEDFFIDALRHFIGVLCRIEDASPGAMNRAPTGICKFSAFASLSTVLLQRD